MAINTYFNVNFTQSVSKNWVILVLTLSSASLMFIGEVSQVYGVDDRPYTLNVQIETLIDNLGDCGVSFVFVPDGRIFCGELKQGGVRVIEHSQLLPDPLIKLDVYHSTKPSGANDERGLTGITIDPEFEKNHYVYVHWTYLDPDNQESYSRVARFTESNNKLTDMTIILDKVPAGHQHVGGPLEFGPDGKLYITGGDGASKRTVQDMNWSNGKIFRINSDGSIPADNPFPELPYYTVGHRNVFGIGFNPITKIPYVTENGVADDEVNILVAGKNYGWPIVTGNDNGEKFVDPLLYFTPAIAPTELLFYTGDRYPSEVNNMFFLSYNERALYRVILKPPNYDEVLSIDSFDIPIKGGGSLTDLEQGPDGYLYVSSFRSIARLVFSYTNVTTTVSLEVQSTPKTQESLRLTAKISDYFGNPISNANIDFFDSDELIGSAVSNHEGIAELEYLADTAGQHRFSAKFEGSEQYKTSYSPQRLLCVDGSVGMPTFESVTAGNIKVRFSWSPSEPTPELPTRFTLEFVDPETNNLLDDVQYDFTVMKNNAILLSKTEQIAINGSDYHEFNFGNEQTGPVQIEVKNVNNTGDNVMFVVNVIPEFPIHVSILVMATLLAISTILMNFRPFKIS